MTMLLFSGESISNKHWIETVAQTFSPLGPTKILYYNHWESGQDSIDFAKEYAKLSAFVEGVGDYVIFAKSIGSVLVARGIYEGILHPQKCIFVGPAWLVGERNIPEFKTWIENFSLPSLFITKTTDPVAPAAELTDLLAHAHVQNFQFVEIPGDNHKYEDLEKLQSLVTDFLK